MDSLAKLPERGDLAEPEGARRATVGSAERPTPDPEILAKPKRRRFTAKYKLQVLREADACKGSGEIGALLRREGLYSSHLSSWREQRDRGALAGLKEKKRGRKAKPVDPRVKQLEKENARLRRRLSKAETIITFQKKLSEILGIPLKSPDSDESE